MTIFEKVKKLVENDAIQSAFISQAITEYADKVLEHQEEVKRDLGKAGWINAEHWIECAKIAKEMINK